jgi:hypothetical protein
MYIIFRLAIKHKLSHSIFSFYVATLGSLADDGRAVRSKQSVSLSHHLENCQCNLLISNIYIVLCINEQ